jgi:maltose alpha-D-glucosyltransferase / alpha-amylase
MTIGVLNEFVSNVGDAWTYTLDELGRYFERVQSRTTETAAAQPAVEPATLTTSAMTAGPVAVAPHDYDAELRESGPLLELADREPPLLAQETIGGYLHWAELIGRRTGELHVALARTDGGPAFTPEPFTRLYQRSLYQSMRSQARTTFELLKAQSRRLDGDAKTQAERVLERERGVYTLFGKLLQQPIQAKRIRCHGDLHLGQMLFTGKDFVIIDFEGEPERPVSERRIKASPLRDVAGMLRSFHYAAHAALRGRAPGLIAAHGAVSLERWAAFWSTWVSAAFMRSYLAEAKQAGFLPSDSSLLQTLLCSYLLEKALYELRYELNNRPDWVHIPLEGILQLIGE